MIQRLIYHFLEKRHFWRYVGFSELAELYASRALRTTALAMVSIFSSVYLYQIGYSVTFIMFYFAIYFALRTLLAWMLAPLVGRWGPKRATVVSNILYATALLCLAAAPIYGLIAIVLYGLLQAPAVTLYEVSYLVDFSKIKQSDHAGKEIGYMNIIDKLAMGISPLIGGGIAFLLGPQATIVVAAILFITASLPLLLSPDPEPRTTTVQLRDAPWRKMFPSVIACGAVGVDGVASSILWSLFVAIVVLSSASDIIYVQMGALASVLTVTSLVASQIYGRITDRRRGGELLQVGVVINALTHLARPFVTTVFGVVSVNIANEACTTAYMMPLTKGTFDMADRLHGYRISYMSAQVGMATLMAAAYSLVIGVLSLWVSTADTLRIGFVIAAPLVALTLLHRLPALTTKRRWL